MLAIVILMELISIKMSMRLVKVLLLKLPKVLLNGLYLKFANCVNICESCSRYQCFFVSFIHSEDLFVTSKLWNTFHRPDLVKKGLEATLKSLNTSYVDLFLIHWPFAYKEEDELFPKAADGSIVFSDVDFLDTWRELEKLVDAGLAKSIGLSNFNKSQTQRVLDNCRIRPTVNQIECHPYLTQQKLTAYLKSVGLVVTAYSPLGSPNRPWVTKDDPVLLEDPKVRPLIALVYLSETLNLIKISSCSIDSFIVQKIQ